MLLDENERLKKELDRVYQRPPFYNPITEASLCAADCSPDQIGIKGIEMATFKEAYPTYIFTLTRLDEGVLKTLAILQEAGFRFKPMEDEDIARPFPQQQPEGLTVAMAGYDRLTDRFYYGSLRGDIARLYNWEDSYALAKELTMEVSFSRMSLYEMSKALTDDEFAEIQAYEELKEEELRGRRSA